MSGDVVTDQKHSKAFEFCCILIECDENIEWY